MEAIYRDYSPKGVQFFYLYKALAHPELHGYVKPVTIEERLQHVKEAQQRIDSGIQWLGDTMANDLKHGIGNAPNSEYVLDPEGKVASKRSWNKPAELRKVLAKLVGEVENRTTGDDVDLKFTAAEPLKSTGIVPRLHLPEFKALKIEPQLVKSKHPFYVKMRAEVEQEFFVKGRGRLYLGFHLDPLYGVHWNNLVAPVEFEFFTDGDSIVSPSKARGPKVKEEADVDPREFLLL
ncbi:MAG: hypothetical protein GY953_47060, partial [bacterium]|nr:hypothetical protein [bacterium]